MATTYKQDVDYINAVINKALLEEYIERIRKNMDPEDLLRMDQLESWAENNDYKKE